MNIARICVDVFSGGGLFMKIAYSSPVILGFVAQGSQGMSNRYMASDTCCYCSGHGSSRA